MGAIGLDGIQLTPLRRIPVEGGDVFHALKSGEASYRGFGEAYFSMIDRGAVKGWKLHRKMTLNLVVPVGCVRFVFYSEDGRHRREETIGEAQYGRLTVPPGIWFAIQGLAEPSSLILNVADIPHDPNEVERKPIDAFSYEERDGERI